MKSMIRVVAPVLALALLAGCAPRGQARPEKTVTKALTTTQAVSSGTRVSVENLVGQVRVSQGGPELQVSATVVAGGKDQVAARALADTIKLDVRKSEGHLVVHVDYPVGQHDRYEYFPTHPDQTHPESVHVLGFQFSSSFSRSRSSLTYQSHDVQVFQNESTGVALHVDLNIRLPAGADAEVINHVGQIHAQDLENTLALQNDSGDISAQGITGDLAIKSGSGDTRVAQLHGSLGVHTGSGDVTAQQVTGAVDLHTGSGDINGDGLHGESLALTTGSGDIDLKDISGALKLNSGSGDITANNVAKIPDARLQSGSGDIELRGDLSGLKGFDLQTGSGDVTLGTANPPAVHLDISGSDIQSHWPDVRNVQSGPRHFSGDVGAATGQGRIRTGSGNVSLTP